MVQRDKNKLFRFQFELQLEGLSLSLRKGILLLCVSVGGVVTAVKKNLPKKKTAAGGEGTANAFFFFKAKTRENSRATRFPLRNGHGRVGV